MDLDLDQAEQYCTEYNKDIKINLVKLWTNLCLQIYTLYNEEMDDLFFPPHWVLSIRKCQERLWKEVECVQEDYRLEDVEDKVTANLFCLENIW